MTDLAEFLLARIAEDEASAREAKRRSDRDWNVGDPSERESLVFADHASPILSTFPEGEAGRTIAAHIACHDPARVLAECEAKRRIVGLWNLRLSIPEPEYGLAGGEPLGGQGAEVYYDALKALALPYADHPDYRAEWRP